jgi:hypothetical protein
MGLLVALEMRIASEVLRITLTALDLSAGHSEFADRSAEESSHVDARISGHEIVHGDMQPQLHLVGWTIGDNPQDALGQTVALPPRHRDYGFEDHRFICSLKLRRAVRMTTATDQHCSPEPRARLSADQVASSVCRHLRGRHDGAGQRHVGSAQGEARIGDHDDCRTHGTAGLQLHQQRLRLLLRLCQEDEARLDAAAPVVVDPPLVQRLGLWLRARGGEGVDHLPGKEGDVDVGTERRGSGQRAAPDLGAQGGIGNSMTRRAAGERPGRVGGEDHRAFMVLKALQKIGASMLA